MLSQVVIKHINSLKIKKYRNKYSEFIAEGEKIIAELIEEGLILQQIYATTASTTVFSDKFQSLLIQDKMTVCTDAELNKITALQHHHQCLAVFSQPDSAFEPDESNWILALDDIQDPGNMGTIIRTCDWFGIKHIVCSEGCVDIYNPKVVQATMASIGRVNVIETDLADFFSKSNREVYGAVLDGANYHTADYSKPGVLLIGNEGKGIKPELMQWVQHKLTIPKIGKAESLNAAIATALLLAKINMS
ncbi:MAG TPA: RNA methyltransferase [Chitinophagales bacterium]|nr:RNA methyltransferase [Chitinophagales bacterium]HNL85218.1 RNA methyltransferase [Chitinophagales bacterium]